MSETELNKGIEGEEKPAVAEDSVKTKKKRKHGVAKYIVLAIACILTALLTVNALLSIFLPHYYPTFGKYRLFAVVTDSMEDTIPRGNMIVSRKPTNEGDIKVGDVITFEANINGERVLNTHRVVAIGINPGNGKTSYTTKGDKKGLGIDTYHPDFDEVVGVFTGKQCGFFGYFFGFLQSTQGAIALILTLFILIVAWAFIYYVDWRDRRRRLSLAALKKSEKQLSKVNLRYDNIREITAVMDVLSMITAEPEKRADEKTIESRLTHFVDAKSIELPQTPETAAVLDSLPAPDTPTTLAAALRNGATLRQAEDGQTLILTSMSGGKSIILTPVQTPDGIILCQQGVRLRSDLAPNIESVGAMSMPDYPEFFEGQPLEKNVEYPELPQHAGGTFGPDLLSGHADEPSVSQPALSAPTAVGQSRLVRLNDGTPDVMRLGGGANAARENDAARSAYAQYRELAAQIELKQTEQLSALLNNAQPISPDDRARIEDYKAELKKNKKPRQPLTPEQRAKRRAVAERRKAEQEAFINALDPADRELYLSEQKLSRARNATIRRLKRLDSDRKLLEKLNEQE